jgi:hypothetical protein
MECWTYRFHGSVDQVGDNALMLPVHADTEHLVAILARQSRYVLLDDYTGEVHVIERKQ